MLLILAIILLLFTAFIMTAIRILRSQTSYQYLLALFGAFVAWFFVLLSRPDSPQIIPFLGWQPEGLFPYSPSLLLDIYSWSFALGVSALLLGFVLTAAAHLSLMNWHSLAGSLILSAIGLLSVLAGNPLTLLIAWAGLDVSEVVFLIIQTEGNLARQRVLLVMSMRASAVGLLLAALIFSWSTGESLTFTAIPAQYSLLLVLAAALRLGVLPIHHPIISESRFKRGLGTLLSLVPISSSLILLSRAAATGVDPRIAPLLLISTVIAACYGAVSWITAPEELSGRNFWIMGMASLALGASIRAQPDASVAWGIACLLSGALIFLSSPRIRLLQPLLYLGVITISGLPFTPLWSGWSAYGRLAGGQSWINLVPAALFSLSLFFIHILMILGYLKHISRRDEDIQFRERWVWVLYTPGLVIIPASHIAIGIFGLPEINTVPLAGWLSGILVSLISSILWLRGRDWMSSLDFIPRNLSKLDPILTFSWLYRLLEAVYRVMRRFVNLISTILEGEGGLLWAMLVVLLLFSLLRS